MSRVIDRYPTPKAPKPMEVVVVSMGRTGTLSLFQALQMLGYDAYHLYTLFAQKGTPHINIMIEGMRAKHFGEGKPYGRAELDKWFADYNALTDVPSYFLEEMVAAYPDAKFILTTRDAPSWLRSMQNTLCVRLEEGNRFPRNVMAFFDPYHRGIRRLTNLFAHFIWNGKSLDDDQAALETFERHNTNVQKMIPKDRLLVMRMEDGLGWEKLCKFLGKDIPDMPYPHSNKPKEFHATARKASLIGTTVFLAKGLLIAAPVIGGVAWYYKYRK